MCVNCCSNLALFNIYTGITRIYLKPYVCLQINLKKQQHTTHIIASDTFSLKLYQTIVQCTVFIVYW